MAAFPGPSDPVHPIVSKILDPYIREEDPEDPEDPEDSFRRYVCRNVDRIALDYDISLEFPGEDHFFGQPTSLLHHIIKDLGLDSDGKDRRRLLQEIWDHCPRFDRYVSYCFGGSFYLSYIRFLLRNSYKIHDNLPDWIQPFYVEALSDYFQYRRRGSINEQGVPVCYALARKVWSAFLGKDVSREIVTRPDDLDNVEIGENIITLQIQYQIEKENWLSMKEHEVVILALPELPENNAGTKQIRYFVGQSYRYQYGLELREIQKDKISDYLAKINHLATILSDNSREFAERYEELFHAEVIRFNLKEPWKIEVGMEVSRFV